MKFRLRCHILFGVVALLQFGCTWGKRLEKDHALMLQMKVENLIEKILRVIQDYYNQIRTELKCIPDEVPDNIIETLKKSIDCVDQNERNYEIGLITPNAHKKTFLKCFSKAKSEVEETIMSINPNLDYCPENMTEKTYQINVTTTFTKTFHINIKNGLEVIKKQINLGNDEKICVVDQGKGLPHTVDETPDYSDPNDNSFDKDLQPLSQEAPKNSSEGHHSSEHHETNHEPEVNLNPSHDSKEHQGKDHETKEHHGKGHGLGKELEVNLAISHQPKENLGKGHESEENLDKGHDSKEDLGKTQQNLGKGHGIDQESEVNLAISHESKENLGKGHESKEHSGKGHETKVHQGKGQEIDQESEVNVGVSHESKENLGQGHDSKEHHGKGHEPEKNLGKGHESKEHYGKGHEVKENLGKGHESKEHSGKGHETKVNNQGKGQEIDQEPEVSLGVSHESKESLGKGHESKEHLGEHQESQGMLGTSEDSANSHGLDSPSEDHFAQENAPQNSDYDDFGADNSDDVDDVEDAVDDDENELSNEENYDGEYGHQVTDFLDETGDLSHGIKPDSTENGPKESNLEGSHTGDPHSKELVDKVVISPHQPQNYDKPQTDDDDDYYAPDDVAADVAAADDDDDEGYNYAEDDDDFTEENNQDTHNDSLGQEDDTTHIKNKQNNTQDKNHSSTFAPIIDDDYDDYDLGIDDEQILFPEAPSKAKSTTEPAIKLVHDLPTDDPDDLGYYADLDEEPEDANYGNEYYDMSDKDGNVTHTHNLADSRGPPQEGFDKFQLNMNLKPRIQIKPKNRFKQKGKKQRKEGRRTIKLPKAAPKKAQPDAAPKHRGVTSLSQSFSQSDF